MHEIKAKIVDLIRANFELTPTSQSALDDIVATIDSVAVSFGNCTICWGRGYTVILDGDAAAKEQRSPELEVSMCDCQRGTQLRVVMQ